MSECQIRFKYCKEDVVIPCQRNEIIRDIIDRYVKNIGLSDEKFCFFYDEKEINLDLTLAQINNKDAEILINVFPRKNERNGDKNKKSHFIKCAKCIDSSIIEFSNDYMITLTDEKHGKLKINLQDYNNIQEVDQNEIKCSKCSNSRTEVLQDQFYYCFECCKIFCKKCNSLHKVHKNKVDYSLKYYICPEHQGEKFVSYCFSCKKNLCSFCIGKHKEHNIINFSKFNMEIYKELIEKIQTINELIDSIIDSLQKFKDNLVVYMKINEKLNENLLKMNLNYENLKSMKNLTEMSFLKKDIEQILNTNDINKKFQKIMSIYDIMNGKTNNIANTDYDDDKIAEVQIKKRFINSNEINIKIKIEQSDVNKNIYFLDNTQESDNKNGYYENGILVKHNHDNLSEMRESNTILIIDGESVPFKKFFIPTKSGIYSIKLLFKNKLYNCEYMFCKCKNIIDIDFSKFNTENVTDMQRMFHKCKGLKLLDLQYFNTKNVTNMRSMFDGCSSLTTINLSSFNTKNVTNMEDMFQECSSLTSINLSSFNTQKVTDMAGMFQECSSLTTLNLSLFNTQNVVYMCGMFQKCSLLKTINLSSFNTQNVTIMRNMFSKCSSLITINLSSFNTQKVTDMYRMFNECSSLVTVNLSSFNTKNVTIMRYMFNKCFSLIKLDLSSFNAAKANTNDMFNGCKNLTSCGSSDENIIDEFNKKLKDLNDDLNK